MGIKLLTLPAGHGKTTWVVDQVIKAAAGLQAQPRVVLPSRLQVQDFELRLAEAGGGMGVQVGTIVDLAGEILDMSGVYSLLLSESVQIKVLREVLAALELNYYQGIKAKPGFVRSCLGIIREFKAGGIKPEAFLTAAEKSGKGPRMRELGVIYAAYQEKLKENDWSDRAGLTWMGFETLLKRPELARDWASVYVDGFDDLTPVQLQLLSSLAGRVDELTLTLTGSLEGEKRELAHKRFLRLRDSLGKEGVEELQLDQESLLRSDGLAMFFENTLFTAASQGGGQVQGEVKLAAVPDREAEVRHALRWLKDRMIREGISPSDSAIMARNLEPYRGLISRIAGEYRIPVHIQGGLPLSENPLIAAIIKLVNMISEGKDGLLWYEVLSLWRSPYFNWSLISDRSEIPYSRERQLAETKCLEEAASKGRVIQGYIQWEQAFRYLIEQGEDLENKAAEKLWAKFSDFVDLLTPPQEPDTRENHIAWLDSLLGGWDPEDLPPGGVRVVQEIMDSPGEIQERDWEALSALNAILKEQIQAERLLGSSPVAFSQFSSELEEIINQRSYQPGAQQEQAVLCAGCTEARGVRFHAAALLGLAEGEFPGTIKEDPFLRDPERLLLSEEYNLPLTLSVDSAESEYFYEALTRADKHLLLTRPRIADNGAQWQPSPYWEEVRRITGAVPDLITTRNELIPDLAGNQAELILQVTAAGNLSTPMNGKANEDLLAIRSSLERSRDVLNQRHAAAGNRGGVYDGNLESRISAIALRYPQDHVWSASRLENYQGCPFRYLIGNLLGLEKLELPEEGLDPRQLGNIYHHILESLYQQAEEEYSLASLLEKLPQVAASVFTDAPRREGFRETAWWVHSQREILENLKLTLHRLEGIDPDYRFFAAEKRFGIGPDQEPPLRVLAAGEGEYLLRGFIDRVDRNAQGELRIVDYKTSGRSGFNNKGVREGKKLQLPLYALAAQEGLGLGKVKEGFYFHLLAAEPSYFRMASYREGSLRGPEAAMERAAEKGWQAVASIKKGNFTPRPPDTGCPEYCPAVDFCWHYQPRRW